VILVTVGTASFDPLIMKVDALVGSGKLQEQVVAQIGRGLYIPKHIRYFRFMRSLQKAYSLASIVVSTGGAGTTMECVTVGKRLVVIENPTLAEGHQAQLLGEMERRGHLIWCKDLASLMECINAVRTMAFTPFRSDPPRIHKIINRMLDNEQ
jgi:UDP-N-acetylglucosamine transferase subunit ALG13